VPVPASRLSRSLFLLPPRNRRLLLIARDADVAASWCRWCREKGWSEVAWLAGSPTEIAAGLQQSGTEPNRLWEPASLLRRFEPQLPRNGLACDLACGSGRNAIFLALGGREVLGVDILPDALRQARVLARAAGLDHELRIRRSRPRPRRA